jgi:hypothetical protein
MKDRNSPRTLSMESTASATISTELAQKAGQYTKKVEVPKWYQKYACVFSEAESQ